MRNPMMEVSESRFTTDRQRDGWVRLDLRELDKLIERAASTAASLNEVGSDMPITANAAGYSEGVKAALAWIAGHHADDRLTKLLDIDEDQR